MLYDFRDNFPNISRDTGYWGPRFQGPTNSPSHRVGDGDTMLIFFPGFQLATGKKGIFLYVFDSAGSQPAPERLQAIASRIDVVYLPVLGLVVPKPISSETTRPISCSGHILPTFGTPRAHLLKLGFYSSIVFFCVFKYLDQIHIGMFYKFVFHIVYTPSQKTYTL